MVNHILSVNKLFKKKGEKVLRPCLLLFISLNLIFSGCGLVTTRPKLEMSMAAAAFLAAKNANANILAPNLFRKAEVLYLKAKSAYRRKYFNKAQQYATQSQKVSEAAEFAAIKKKVLDNVNPE